MLRIELENLEPDAARPPLGEPKPQEHVVGEADSSQQKLYGLSMRWERAATETMLEARYASDTATQERNVARATELLEKANKLRDVFWISLKDAFGLWDKPAVGVRAGWKVVWFEPDQAQGKGPMDFLRGMFGGGA